jgi:hypothetical protein
MLNDATPVLIEDEATTPVPFLTMVELVFGEETVNEEALWNEGPVSYAEDR